MTPLDLRALLDSLHQHGVSFVVIGGVAVGAHGYVRAKGDQRVPGVPGYSELERNAVTSDLLGVPVRVCSLEHLRRMKEARGGTQDLADLERLPPLD